jgi:hypothetical protein
MDLRPCGIGENGEYLDVADHPRPPAGAKQSASQWLRSRLALPWARSERTTGTRPPLGAGAAVDPGQFIPLFAWTGWDPAMSDLDPTH